MSKTLLKMSSISQKVFMALAGVFLLVFLLVHLGINLFLLRNDGGDWFNQAAAFMSSNYIVKVFEIFLFGSFLFHILIGVILKLQNWGARPKGYAVAGKAKTSFFSRYMIWTGLTIFVVLFIHLINFYFVKLGLVAVPDGVTDKHDFYSMVILLFQNPLYCVIYYIWLLVLGLHLYHAFQSVFQTFGFNHNKYTPTIKILAALYALIVSIGFMIIPTFFLLFHSF
ncbi:MAG: succinate dehydrogenase [Bacteroidetes bacterium HGW-Bacteroidetes-6]|jgi:succinate dehydrogenase / fumarate reductase cytochrome b subunit|nr:MAG: succinate dehydrogenase [Bacteroidetes bacterium HGW-Bacteroidetes-6]